MDEYIGLINKLENTLQQQAKEMEEKRKVEELKAAEKKRQARKAEKGEKADAAPTAIPAEPPADKPAKKQFVRNDTRKKTFRQSNKIIDEFLAQPPVFSQKEKKADGTKGEAHTRTYQETPKGKERKSKKDFWEDENPDIINKLRRTKGKRSSKEAQKEQQKPPERKKAITMGEFITVKELSEKIGIQVSEIIKRLMKLGVLATINQELDYDTAALVASEFDIELEKKAVKSFEEILEQEDVEDAPDDLRAGPGCYSYGP